MSKVQLAVSEKQKLDDREQKLSLGITTQKATHNPQVEKQRKESSIMKAENNGKRSQIEKRKAKNRLQ